MLLETIQRHDTTQQVKLVCVEVLRSKGQQIPVSTVPTLITLPERRQFVGKAVFDYLLLPGKGKLLIPVQTPPAQNQQPQSQTQTQIHDPIAFTFNSNFGDYFTDIDHSESTTDKFRDDRNYILSKLDDQTPISVGNFSPEETRQRKPSIDLEQFKMQRDMDLHSPDDVNPSLALPPAFTR
jgi:hypothetical protein